MSLLTLLANLLVGGFNLPLFKDFIRPTRDGLDVCSNGSCVEHKG